MSLLIRQPWDMPNGWAMGRTYRLQCGSGLGHKQSHYWLQAPGRALLMARDEMSHGPLHSSPGEARHQRLHGNGPRE